VFSSDKGSEDPPWRAPVFIFIPEHSQFKLNFSKNSFNNFDFLSFSGSFDPTEMGEMVEYYK
jgi:hypothetical protein